MSSEWPGIKKAIADEIATVRVVEKVAQELSNRGVPEPDAYEADDTEPHRLAWLGPWKIGTSTWAHVFRDDEGDMLLQWSDGDKYSFVGESFHTSNYDEVANRIKEVLKVIGWKEPV